MSADRFPIIRHLWAWLGLQSVDRGNILRLLKGGTSVVLIPGGVAVRYGHAALRCTPCQSLAKPPSALAAARSLPETAGTPPCGRRSTRP